MKKKYKPSVIISCIIAVIALIFAVYTLVWFSYGKIVFSKYIDNVPKYQHTRYTGVDKNGFTYHIKTPSYFSFEGNLSVSPPLENNSPASGLIIWVAPKNKLTFGVMLEHKEQTHQIYIDKNGNAVRQPNMYEEEYEINKSIVILNTDYISDLLSKADECWGVTNGKKVDLNLKSIE